MSVGKRPIYLQVVDSIAEDTREGRLAVGDRLASEREQAAHFGVNRRTLRQALEVLEGRGLVSDDRARAPSYHSPTWSDRRRSSFTSPTA